MPGTNTERLSWGLFCRFFCLQAGVLFCLAGLICFVAFNWAALPAFAKFGLIISLMLGTAALARIRGEDSGSGGLALLACGLLAGPLLAVFGQTYQTGADAWELFLAWGLFLLPLALAGQKTALWLALWLVSTIWIILYTRTLSPSFLDPDGYFLSSNFFFIARSPAAIFQLACLLAWETAARFLPPRPFLFSRLLPRLIALFLLALLTFRLGYLFLVHFREIRPQSLFLFFPFDLFLFCLCAGGWWYGHRRPDIPILAMGLFSLILLALCLFVGGHIAHSYYNVNFMLPAFQGALLVIGGTALSARLLRSRLRALQPVLDRLEEERRAACLAREGKNPQGADGRGGQILPFSGGLAVQLFALTGRLPQAPESPERENPAKPPWFLRLLIGLGAWTALPLLLAAMLLAGAQYFSPLPATLLVLSLLGMGLAFALTFAQGEFLRQSALSLALAGSVGISLALPWEYAIEERFVLLPAVLVCAAGFLLLKIPLYRTCAAAAVPVLLMLQAILWENGLFALQKLESRTTADISGALLAAASSLCAAYLFRRPAPPDKAGLILPLRNGLLAGLFCLTLFAAYAFPGHPARGAGPGAGLGLIFTGLLLPSSLGIGRPGRFLFPAAAVLIAALSWRLPWLSSGFLALLLARMDKNLPLMGLSVAFLALAVNVEYYLQDISLLLKSGYLAATGLLLLGMGLLAGRVLKAAIASGWLPSLADSQPEKSPAPPGGAEAPSAGGLPELLRKTAPAAALAVFLLLFCVSAGSREYTLSRGTVMILDLRPVDPRSLMQGDYMILNLDLEEDIENALARLPAAGTPRRGTAIVALDGRGLASFLRLEDEGSPPAGQEHRLKFRYDGWKATVGGGSFFFQEDRQESFSAARRAELRVSAAGDAIVTHLLDGDGRRLPAP
ncbi:MAG: GDYXXLXY domain-containing protein [Desulfovibrio sp.]|jgi:uncharacterized membrane-anchored protein/uncharacterized membrane protein|nr:GDYXXLXY domain-containing protein [Desulfovibrio sp.]